MKKILSFTAALALLCCMTACGSNAADSTASNNDSSIADTTTTPADTTSAPETTTTEAAAPEESQGGEDSQPAATGETPAQALLADFKAKMASGDAYTPETMAQALVTNPALNFMAVTQPMEPGFLNGFDQDITDFKECCFFGPMIGSIPFAGYVFSVKDDGDANALVETLKANANPAWNICVTADETVCEAVDGMVFFLMAPASLEEEPLNDDEIAMLG